MLKGKTRGEMGQTTHSRAAPAGKPPFRRKNPDCHPSTSCKLSACWDTGQMVNFLLCQPLAVSLYAGLSLSLYPSLRASPVTGAGTRSGLPGHRYHRSPFPVPLSWQVLRPVPSQADNYHLPASVVMSPGAHFPSKQFTRQILQGKRSPTEGPGRRAVPVVDAEDI